MSAQTVKTVDLKGYKLFRRGKVRDVYDLGEELLLISTDRISCFDVVLPDCIPHKGEVLTKLSIFWFDYTRNVVKNHFITAKFEEFPEGLQRYKDQLQGRSMITKKAKLVPFECVVRGYLSGSGWKEYKKNQSICGVKLPKGLRESDKLPEPIFTPATKEDEGHDLNVDENYVADKVGVDMTKKLKDHSIALYRKANDYAEGQGIIIADTKFEFGVYQDKLILIDEVLTPDSSRFWPKDRYKPGQGQPSFDKQYVRDYLETLDWDKTPPGPNLPQNIIEETSRKYIEICDLLVKNNSLV